MTVFDVVTDYIVICLVTYVQGETLTVVGHGYSLGVSNSNNGFALVEGNITALSHEECYKEFSAPGPCGHFTYYGMKPLGTFYLCGKQGPIDTCGGDSGGKETH